MHNLQKATRPSDHEISHHQHQITILHHKTPPPSPSSNILGTLIHSKTRSKTLIDKLYDVGISVSCGRVLSISTEFGNKVIDQFNHEGVVCPLSLRVGAITTAAIDNIDHNSSFNTATNSFCRTAISLFHHPSLDKGDEKEVPDFQIKHKNLKKLRSYYKDIKPATFNKTVTTQEPNALKDTANDIPSTKASSNDRNEEEWLEVVVKCIEKATDH